MSSKWFVYLQEQEIYLKIADFAKDVNNVQDIIIEEENKSLNDSRETGGEISGLNKSSSKNSGHGSLIDESNDQSNILSPKRTYSDQKHLSEVLSKDYPKYDTEEDTFDFSTIASTTVAYILSNVHK